MSWQLPMEADNWGLLSPSPVGLKGAAGNDVPPQWVRTDPICTPCHPSGCEQQHTWLPKLAGPPPPFLPSAPCARTAEIKSRGCWGRLSVPSRHENKPMYKIPICFPFFPRNQKYIHLFSMTSTCSAKFWDHPNPFQLCEPWKITTLKTFPVNPTHKFLFTAQHS